MPTFAFAKVITIAVFLQPLALAAPCDENPTSCKQEREETSLLQTKAVVQHGTAAQDGQPGGGSSGGTAKGVGATPAEECAKQNALDVGGTSSTKCYCALGLDCATSLSWFRGARTSDNAKCIWSPPGEGTFRPGKGVTATGDFSGRAADASGFHSVLLKPNTDWGLWYFDRVHCPTCTCADTYAPERALDKTTAVDAQVAALATLIYQDVGCPKASSDIISDKWKTQSGWELAIGQNDKPICQNTRDNAKMSYRANSSEYNSAAHDNFALFVNKLGNTGVPAKTCVLAIEGTTFNGVKNWMNDASTSSKPWCGMNVQSGFKSEVMQFLGNWGYQENTKLVDQSYNWYSQAEYDADRTDARTNIMVPFKQFINSNGCSDLWVTGHSLGGAMAELFAMCWNKPFNDVGGATQDVSKVYTFGAPSAFDPYRIPPSKWKRTAGEKTEWTTCFGGKRFFNMNSDTTGEFDPVPVIATDLGWMHLPYDAVQLGLVSVQTTECSKIPNSKFKTKDDAVPKDCPVCQLPHIPDSGSIASKIPGSTAATYLTNGAALHSMTVYEDRLKPDSETQRGR